MQESDNQNELAAGPQLRRRKVRKRVSSSSSSEKRARSSKGRRRRRSGKQTKRPRSKWPFYVFSLLFLAGFAGALAATFAIGYYNSSNYRSEFLKSLEKETQAVVSIEGMRVSPSSAEAKEVLLEWQGDLTESLRLTKVRTKYLVTALLSGGFSEAELSAETGLLELGVSLGAPYLLTANDGEENNWGVGSLGCGALDVLSESVPLITGSFTQLKWHGVAQQAFFSGGKLNQTPLGPLEIQQGFVRYNTSRPVYEFRLNAPDSEGQIIVKGKLPVEDGGSEPIAFSLEAVSSAELLGDTLGQVVQAKLNSTEGAISAYSSSIEKMKYEVDVTSRMVDLGRLDCFNVLAQVLRKNGYRRPRFTSGSKCKVTRDGEKVTLSEINFNERGVLMLRGSLSERNGDISGDLLIGLPQRYEQELEKQFGSKTFAAREHGFVWQQVKVSGEVGDLRDDLRAQLLKSKSPSNSRKTEEPKESKENKAPTTQSELESAFDKLLAE